MVGRTRVVVAAVTVAVAVGGCSGSPRPRAVGGSSTAAGSSTQPRTVPRPIQATVGSSATSIPSPRPVATGPGSATAAPSPASTVVAARLLGQDWTRIPTSRHVVALTFDAGGDDAGVAAILGTLAREHVRATFFLTGHWAQTFPAQARRIAASYRLGDHSMTHPHFTGLSADQIKHQVLDSAAAIEHATGVGPAPFFRFPYGNQNAGILAQVNGLGFITVRWSVDTLGWQGARAGATTPRIINRVLAALAPGEIVLMHVGATPADGSTPDANALPEIIRALKARHYDFVTVDALQTGRR